MIFKSVQPWLFIVGCALANDAFSEHFSVSAQKVQDYKKILKRQAEIQEYVQYTPYIVLGATTLYLLHKKFLAASKSCSVCDTVKTLDMNLIKRCASNHKPFFNGFLGSPVVQYVGGIALNMALQRTFYWAIGSIGVSNMINRYWFKDTDVEWFMSYRIPLVQTTHLMHNTVAYHTKQLSDKTDYMIESTQLAVMQKVLDALASQLEYLYAYVEFSLERLNISQEGQANIDVSIAAQQILHDLIANYQEMLDLFMQVSENSYRLILLDTAIMQFKKEIQCVAEKHQQYMSLLNYEA